jgi:hypothetical protein
MELYCTPKVNTLQLNTVCNSWNTRTRPTRTVSEHLTPIEFFQQDLLWQSSNNHPHSCSQKASKHTRSIRRRAIGPLAHNGTSAYSPSLTCHLPAPTIECLRRPPYKLTCSSRPTYKHVCVRPISRPDCSISVEVRRLQNTLLWKSTTACLRCCTTMKLGCQVLSRI